MAAQSAFVPRFCRRFGFGEACFDTRLRLRGTGDFRMVQSSGFALRASRSPLNVGEGGRFRLKYQSGTDGLDRASAGQTGAVAQLKNENSCCGSPRLGRGRRRLSRIFQP